MFMVLHQHENSRLDGLPEIQKLNVGSLCIQQKKIELFVTIINF